MGDDSKSASDAVRLDLWLWAVRLFKTRSQAAQACRKGAVTIRDASVKPSRTVRIGEEIVVQKRYLKQIVRVVGLLTQRVGAKLVADYYEDLTPESEIEAARARSREVREAPQRESGAGRPTKKDRRAVDEMEEIPEEPVDDSRRQELFEKWMRKTDL